MIGIHLEVLNFHRPALRHDGVRIWWLHLGIMSLGLSFGSAAKRIERLTEVLNRLKGRG